MTAFKNLFRPMLTAVSLAVATSMAHAGERESLESLRQTTLNLIEALVQSGVLPRDKADALLRDAQRKATDAVAPNVAEVAPAATAGALVGAAAAKPVQRVPYVSETMRAQIRNEVKEEVLSQARLERWGVPNAPSWVDRIRIDGDFRYRYQSDRYDPDNTPAEVYAEAELGDIGRLSRAPDFGALAFNDAGTPVPLASTQGSRDRERIRLRLGLTAKVTDEVGVGVRLASGNDSDRVSTNQTLGQNFNKYQIFIDRAFVKVDPTDWLSIRAGRIPNPWFHTDMAWSDNLNFEGVATTASWLASNGTMAPFATLGWFPLKEEEQGVRGRRTLMGAQVGSSFELDSRTKFKLGLAYYKYHNLAGMDDTDYPSVGGVPVVNPATFGRYEYPAGLRQKGNTVFETGPITEDPKWGLAYRFAPVVLTGSAEFRHFSPYTLTLTGEYAKNSAFDVADFQRRAGASYAGVDPGGKDDGYQLKVAFGAAEVQEAGQWQVSATYRHVGSDAVLDAFTDSDLGLGGTNLEGYILGLSYGLYRNTSLGVRYLSSNSIDTTINSLYPTAKFGVNTLQVDFNVRF